MRYFAVWSHFPFGGGRQRGAALIVTLILLIIVTLLALSNLQTVALEEKMTAATYDRQIAFQAAEAALREAEQYVEQYVKQMPPDYCTDAAADGICPSDAINNCTNGVCPPPDKDCPSRWLPAAGFEDEQWRDASVSLPALAGTPQYFIECLGTNFPCREGVKCPDSINCTCKRYRITARSNPGTGRASVMLQSVYATD